MLEEDGDRRNLPISSVMKEVADIVLTQWRKSNNKFIPPVVVTKDALHFRLQIAWETISDISRGRANKASKLKWDSELDKLLNITVCQCEIEVYQAPSNTYKHFDKNE